MSLLPDTDAAVTGVGSLPFLEDDAAIALVEELSPEVPFLPQFPKRSRSLQMLLEPFIGAGELIAGEGKVSIQKGRLDTLRSAAKCGELEPSPLRPVWERVLATAGVSTRVVKGQLCGPFTLLSQVQYIGAPLGTVEEGCELAFDLLLFRAREQLKMLAEVGVPKVLVFDEPVLPYLKKKDFLDRSPLVRVFQRLVEALSDDATIGLHCCGPVEGDFFGVLWERLGIELLSVPIEYSQRLITTLPASWLPPFLGRGGSLVLGAIPTLRRSEQVEPERFLAKLKAESAELGVELPSLLRRSLVSASCGLGLLREDEARESFRRATELQNLFRAYL